MYGHKGSNCSGSQHLKSQGERGERWAEAGQGDDSQYPGEAQAAPLWTRRATDTQVSSSPDHALPPPPLLTVVDVPNDGSPGFNKPRLAEAGAVVTSGQPPSLTWHSVLLPSAVLLINTAQAESAHGTHRAESESWLFSYKEAEVVWSVS